MLIFFFCVFLSEFKSFFTSKVFQGIQTIDSLFFRLICIYTRVSQSSRMASLGGLLKSSLENPGMQNNNIIFFCYKLIKTQTYILFEIFEFMT